MFLLAMFAALQADIPPSQPPVAGDAAAIRSERSPAARRARQVIDLIDRGDRAAMRAFIDSSYSPAALRERSAAARMNSYAQMHHQSQGASFVRFGEITDTSAQVLFHNRLLNRLQRLTVRVDPNPPHYILGVTP